MDTEGGLAWPVRRGHRAQEPASRAWGLRRQTFDVDAADVGSTVYAVSNWDRGCCIEVVGVFATEKEAKKMGGMLCSPLVVEG